MAYYDNYVDMARQRGYISDDLANQIKSRDASNSALSSVGGNIASGISSSNQGLNFNDLSKLYEQIMSGEMANVQRMIDAESAAATTAWQRSEASAEAQRQWASSQNALTRQHDEDMINLAHQLNEQSAQASFDRQLAASNSAYQRAVDDLKAAGLNPILAVGGQASTPSSSAASVNAIGSGAVGGVSADAYKANTGKGDLSSIFGSIAQLFAAGESVSASLYHTDTMSKTAIKAANRQLIGSIIGGVANVAGRFFGAPVIHNNGDTYFG